MTQFSYYLFRLGGVIAPKITPSVGYAMCRLLAWLFYLLNTQGKRNIQQNLQRISGENTLTAEINRQTRLTFCHIFYNYFDLFRLPGLNNATVNNLVTIEGWDNLKAALAKGKGVVMSSAHLGNFDIILHAMSLLGVNIIVPVERVDPPQLFNYVTTLRSKEGLKLIPVDGPLLDLVRTLKKGGVVGLAADRDITGSGQIEQFFSYPAHLPTGSIKLALKTDAPLVLAFFHRKPDHSYHARFLPAYLPLQTDTATQEQRIAAGMQYIVKEMENAIRQTPEQWTLTVSIWADSQNPISS